MLALVLVLAVPVSAFAADGEKAASKAQKALLSLSQKAVDCAVGAIASFYPTPKAWSNPDTDTGFMAGTEEILSAPAQSAVFSLG